jgi:hypothetical protein
MIFDTTINAIGACLLAVPMVLALLYIDPKPVLIPLHREPYQPKIIRK